MLQIADLHGVKALSRRERPVPISGGLILFRVVGHLPGERIRASIRQELLFRVVGHLPGERTRASIRHELRAGVAQASREETAATATGGCSRH